MLALIRKETGAFGRERAGARRGGGRESEMRRRVVVGGGRPPRTRRRRFIQSENREYARGPVGRR